VPAPAVIPAPRAYINAVAVKGFVVELWIVRTVLDVCPLPTEQGLHACNPRTSETSITGSSISPTFTRSMPASENARVHYCD